MRVVVALGGNALLKRGEPMTARGAAEEHKVAAEAMVPVSHRHQLVISHGNGPQVGLLALQGPPTSPTRHIRWMYWGPREGMIGYIIEQELGNLLSFGFPSPPC